MCQCRNLLGQMYLKRHEFFSRSSSSRKLLKPLSCVNIVKSAPHWPSVLIAIHYACHLMVHIEQATLHGCWSTADSCFPFASQSLAVMASYESALTCSPAPATKPIQMHPACAISVLQSNPLKPPINLHLLTPVCYLEPSEEVYNAALL